MFFLYNWLCEKLFAHSLDKEPGARDRVATISKVSRFSEMAHSKPVRRVMRL
jgi:predicted oxidoreductase